jgi:glucose-1-phosphate adenylyltransferase
MGQDRYETFEEQLHNDEKGIPPMGIGKNCKLVNCIVDRNARVGDNVTLTPEGKPDLFEHEGIVVRDGVLVVTANTIVPSGTKV